MYYQRLLVSEGSMVVTLAIDGPLVVLPRPLVAPVVSSSVRLEKAIVPCQWRTVQCSCPRLEITITGASDGAYILTDEKFLGKVAQPNVGREAVTDPPYICIDACSCVCNNNNPRFLKSQRLDGS